jgi:hypothetical protein
VSLGLPFVNWVCSANFSFDNWVCSAKVRVLARAVSMNFFVRSTKFHQVSKFLPDNHNPGYPGFRGFIGGRKLFF